MNPTPEKTSVMAPFILMLFLYFIVGLIYRYQPAISGPSEISPATPRWKYD